MSTHPCDQDVNLDNTKTRHQSERNQVNRSHQQHHRTIHNDEKEDEEDQVEFLEHRQQAKMRLTNQHNNISTNININHSTPGRGKGKRDADPHNDDTIILSHNSPFAHLHFSPSATHPASNSSSITELNDRVVVLNRGQGQRAGNMQNRFPVQIHLGRKLTTPTPLERGLSLFHKHPVPGTPSRRNDSVSRSLQIHISDTSPSSSFQYFPSPSVMTPSDFSHQGFLRDIDRAPSQSFSEHRRRVGRGRAYQIYNHENEQTTQNSHSSLASRPQSFQSSTMDSNFGQDDDDTQRILSDFSPYNHFTEVNYYSYSPKSAVDLSLRDSKNPKNEKKERNPKNVKNLQHSKGNVQEMYKVWQDPAFLASANLGQEDGIGSIGLDSIDLEQRNPFLHDQSWSQNQNREQNQNQSQSQGLKQGQNQKQKQNQNQTQNQSMNYPNHQSQYHQPQPQPQHGDHSDIISRTSTIFSAANDSSFPWTTSTGTAHTTTTTTTTHTAGTSSAPGPTSTSIDTFSKMNSIILNRLVADYEKDDVSIAQGSLSDATNLRSILHYFKFRKTIEPKVAMFEMVLESLEMKPQLPLLSFGQFSSNEANTSSSFSSSPATTSSSSSSSPQSPPLQPYPTTRFSRLSLPLWVSWMAYFLILGCGDLISALVVPIYKTNSLISSAITHSIAILCAIAGPLLVNRFNPLLVVAIASIAYSTYILCNLNPETVFIGGFVMGGASMLSVANTIFILAHANYTAEVDYIAYLRNTAVDNPDQDTLNGNNEHNNAHNNDNGNDRNNDNTTDHDHNRNHNDNDPNPSSLPPPQSQSQSPSPVLEMAESRRTIDETEHYIASVTDKNGRLIRDLLPLPDRTRLQLSTDSLISFSMAMMQVASNSGTIIGCFVGFGVLYFFKGPDEVLTNMSSIIRILFSVFLCLVILGNILLFIAYSVLPKAVFTPVEANKLIETSEVEGESEVVEIGSRRQHQQHDDHHHDHHRISPIPEQPLRHSHHHSHHHPNSPQTQGQAQAQSQSQSAMNAPKIEAETEPSSEPSEIEKQHIPIVPYLLLSGFIALQLLKSKPIILSFYSFIVSMCILGFVSGSFIARSGMLKFIPVELHTLYAVTISASALTAALVLARFLSINTPQRSRLYFTSGLTLSLFTALLIKALPVSSWTSNTMAYFVCFSITILTGISACITTVAQNNYVSFLAHPAELRPVAFALLSILKSIGLIVTFLIAVFLDYTLQLWLVIGFICFAVITQGLNCFAQWELDTDDILAKVEKYRTTVMERYNTKRGLGLSNQLPNDQHTDNFDENPITNPNATSDPRASAPLSSGRPTFASAFSSVTQKQSTAGSAASSFFQGGDFYGSYHQRQQELELCSIAGTGTGTGNGHRQDQQRGNQTRAKPPSFVTMSSQQGHQHRTGLSHPNQWIDHESSGSGSGSEEEEAVAVHSFHPSNINNNNDNNDNNNNNNDNDNDNGDRDYHFVPPSRQTNSTPRTNRQNPPTRMQTQTQTQAPIRGGETHSHAHPHAQTPTPVYLPQQFSQEVCHGAPNLLAVAPLTPAVVLDFDNHLSFNALGHSLLQNRIEFLTTQHQSQSQSQATKRHVGTGSATHSQRQTASSSSSVASSKVSTPARSRYASNISSVDQIELP